MLPTLLLATRDRTGVEITASTDLPEANRVQAAPLCAARSISIVACWCTGGGGRPRSSLGPRLRTLSATRGKPGDRDERRRFYSFLSHTNPTAAVSTQYSNCSARTREAVRHSAAARA